jgi:hypothetical protein
MISARLASALAAFDETALATLANAGLVRRAERDIAKGKVAVRRVEGDAAVLGVDGEEVRIGPGGPSDAACTCPAAGLCRHRIAAVMLLRDAQQGGEQGSAAEPETSPDPQEWLGEITLAAARRFAGRPAWRAALEMLDQAKGVEPSGTGLAVQFDGLDGPVLILRGQGMEGIVSKAGKARRKAVHAAALLAARRHYALPTEDAESDAASMSATAAALALGPDPAFLAALRDALGDVAALGFNLAPLPLEERLFELSVSSRADALPRLAALLRAIAAQMRLRRARSFEFDAGELLERCAIAFALTHAVTREGLNSSAFARLAGVVRRTYEPVGELELIGTGAEEWRAGTGARGVTAHFIEPESGAFRSVAFARGPGQDPGFVPREAFGQQALWGGGTMESLCRARLRLTNAGLAEGGRLASGAEVRAAILSPRANPPDEHTHRDWMALQDDLAARFGLGIEATGAPQMALIRPSGSARPQFDELAQQLLWPVRDGAGRWLALTFDHDERSDMAISALDSVMAQNWTGTLLVRAAQVNRGVEITPVTVFTDPEPLNLTLWRPQRNWRTKRPDLRDWLQRLRPDPGKDLRRAPPCASAAAVQEAWRHLIDRLEAGEQLARLLDDKRAAHAARLSDFGMPGLAAALAAAEGGSALLRAGYALLAARQQRLALPLLA